MHELIPSLSGRYFAGALFGDRAMVFFYSGAFPLSPVLPYPFSTVVFDLFFRVILRLQTQPILRPFHFSFFSRQPFSSSS